MTALLDPPAASPVAPDPVPEPVQLAHVFANLMPEEIVADRRLRKLKRRLVLGLTGLVVVLALAYAYSWQQTSSAQDDLSAAQAQSQSQNSKLHSFDALVKARSDTALLKTELGGVMVDDLPWSTLIATIDRSAPAGLSVSSLSGTVTGPTTTGTAGIPPVANPLNSSGLQVVGNLTITGTTGDYRSVATFVQTLSTTKGFAVVDPASLAGDHGRVMTFSVRLSLTTDALGGRFTLPTTATAGAAGAAGSTSTGGH